MRIIILLITLNIYMYSSSTRAEPMGSLTDELLIELYDMNEGLSVNPMDTLIDDKEARMHKKTKKGRIIIQSEGEGNRIRIDSTEFTGTGKAELEGKYQDGEVIQQGDKNQADIQSSGGEGSNSANKVYIKQQGNNNKVSIRQD
jgi:hypothetical protein